MKSAKHALPTKYAKRLERMLVAAGAENETTARQVLEARVLPYFERRDWIKRLKILQCSQLLRLAGYSDAILTLGDFLNPQLQAALFDELDWLPATPLAGRKMPRGDGEMFMFRLYGRLFELGDACSALHKDLFEAVWEAGSSADQHFRAFCLEFAKVWAEETGSKLPKINFAKSVEYYGGGKAMPEHSLWLTFHAFGIDLDARTVEGVVDFCRTTAPPKKMGIEQDLGTEGY